MDRRDASSWFVGSKQAADLEDTDDVKVSISELEAEVAKFTKQIVAQAHEAVW